MTAYSNSFEGGSNGTTITAANSGGASGDAWSTTQIATGGALIFDSTHAAHGSLSGKLVTGSTGRTFLAKSFVGSPATWAFRVYVYAATNGDLAAFQVTSRSGLSDAYVAFDSAGHLTVVNGSATVLATFTTAVPLNAWFRVEGQFTLATTATGSYSVSLYTSMDSATATETKSASSVTFAAATVSNVSYRVITGTAQTVWVDDAAQNDTAAAIGPWTSATVSGAVSMAATAGMTIGGGVTVLAVDTLAGSAGLTVAAAVTELAAVSMAATAGLSASGSMSAMAAVSMSAAAAATVAGQSAAFAAVSLTATASLTVAGSATAFGLATLSATAAMSVGAAVYPPGRYWVGGTGTWDNTATTHWSTYSGGPGGASPPASTDNVYFDANSGGGTVSTTTGLNLVGSVDFTGWTGTLGGGFTISASGNVTLGTTGHGFSAALVLNMRNAAGTVQTLTSNGQTANQLAIGSGTTAGSVQLVDGLTLVGALTLTIGTFDPNGQAWSIGSFSSNNSNTRSIVGTSTGTLTSTAAATIWNASASLVLSAGTTIVVGTAATSTRTFAGGGLTYALTYTVANSPGALVITGANTFTALNIGPGRQLVLPSSTTSTFNGWGGNGAPNGYLYLPGVSGNHASTPDSTAVSVTGDIDVRAKVALDNWAGAAATFFAKVDNFTTLTSYQFEVQPNGFVRFLMSSNGAAWTKIYAATAALSGLVNGSATWVRATRVAATGNCTFYQSSDGITWTQVGAVVTGPTGNIFASTANLVVGATNAGTGTLAVGKFYRAQIRNNVLDDGTGIVFDADFTTKTVGANTFAESSTNAATVTINGALAQAGDGRVAVSASTPGTQATLNYAAAGGVSSDYLWLKDTAATPANTWFAGHNSTDVSNNTGWVFGSLIIGAVSMSAAAAVTVGAVVARVATVNASATAAMSVAGQAAAFAAVTYTASAALTVAGSATAFGLATLSATAAMSVTAIRVAPGTVTLAATSGLTVAPAVTELASVIMAAVASLTPAVPTLYRNSFNAGTAGAAITAANSGTSGDAFDSVVATGTGAAVTYDSATVAHGSNAAKMNVGSASADVQLNKSVAAGTTAFAFRTYLYGGTLTNLRACDINFLTGGAAGTTLLGLTFTGGALLVNGGVLATFTTLVTAGSWFRVECQADLVAGTWAVQLFTSMDSVTPTESHSGTTTFAASSIDTAQVDGNAGGAQVFYVDEWALATLTTTPIGPWTAVSGVVAMSATSSLVTSAAVAEFAAVSLTASAALSPVAVVTKAGAVSMAATAGLTAVPAVTVRAAVTLAASAGMTSAAVVTVIAASAMSGATTMTVAGVRTQFGAVSMTAAGALTAAGVRSVAATVTLAASATLTTAGSTTEVAAVSLTAGTTLTTVALLTRFAAATLTASAALTVAGSATAFGLATLSATAAMSVTAIRVAPGTVTLAAAAGLTAGAAVTELAAVSCAATATLTAGGFATTSGGAAMTAATTMTVAGTRGVVGLVAMVATSVVTVGATVTTFAAVTMTATARLSAPARATTFGRVAMTAQASASVGSVVTTTGLVHVRATAGMTVAGRNTVVAAVAMTSVAHLTASGRVTAVARVQLTATAVLTVGPVVTEHAAVAMAARASMTAGVPDVQVLAAAALIAVAVLTPGTVVEATGVVAFGAVAALTTRPVVDVLDVAPMVAVAAMSAGVPAVTDVALVRLLAAASAHVGGYATTAGLIEMHAVARWTVLGRLLALALGHGDAYTAWQVGTPRTGWRVGDATLAWQVGILRTAARTGQAYAEYETAAPREM